MMDIKQVLLMALFLSLWSCKGKDKAVVVSPIKEDSVQVVQGSEEKLMNDNADPISVNNENLQDKDESKIATAEKITPKSKEQRSKNVISIKPNNEKLTESNIEKLAIKPVSEPSKEISTETGKVKDTPKASTNVEEVVLVNHQLFDVQLNKYVNAGKVNYKAWKKDMTGLQNYLDNLSAAKNIDKWSYEEKLVFWINTYNAFTLKLVLDNYPIKSIKDINGGKPWDKRFIQIGSTYYSLNEIENEIIRKKFGEPRIHFALNCAAKSCPILVNKAFTKENLNSLLESNTKNFINGPENTITKDKLEISSIFDWYGIDFDDLRGFIGKYALTKPSPNAKITFKNYNWALNE
ncbi:MAG TPA: DUF547 domain-containing protein [Saprospiraceae bacterium]|nr:DUF547 domain-containing protein [Saprospiraceae bacterium]HMU05573.1 DUF547 domain-containing protein [Saprospiraceae bacterium]